MGDAEEARENTLMTVGDGEVAASQEAAAGAAPAARPVTSTAVRPSSVAANTVYSRHRDGGDSTGLSHKEREERVRQFRQLQQEEATRKKELLAQQDELAARQRAQAERDRRRRYEELRLKEQERRSQVDERRRQLELLEAERRATILRRSAEREAMLENRRRHTHSQILLGFGSSTPRWELQADMGKRSTSTLQMDASLDGSLRPGSAAYSRLRPDESGSARRYRSDLQPSVPTTSMRGASAPAGRRSAPGKAVSMTRLDQLARPRKAATLQPVHEPPASPGNKSMWRSMMHLPEGVGGGALRRGVSASVARLSPPRPARTEQLRRAPRQPPTPAPGTNVPATPTSPSRPTSSLSQQSGGGGVALRTRPSPRRPRPASIAITPGQDATPNTGRTPTTGSRTPVYATGSKTPGSGTRSTPGSKTASTGAKTPSTGQKQVAGGNVTSRASVDGSRPTPSSPPPSRRKSAASKAGDTRRQMGNSTTPQPSPSVEIVAPISAEDTTQPVPSEPMHKGEAAGGSDISALDPSVACGKIANLPVSGPDADLSAAAAVVAADGASRESAPAEPAPVVVVEGEEDPTVTAASDVTPPAESATMLATLADGAATGHMPPAVEDLTPGEQPSEPMPAVVTDAAEESAGSDSVVEDLAAVASDLKFIPPEVPSPTAANATIEATVPIPEVVVDGPPTGAGAEVTVDDSAEMDAGDVTTTQSAMAKGVAAAGASQKNADAAAADELANVPAEQQTPVALAKPVTPTPSKRATTPPSQPPADFTDAQGRTPAGYTSEAEARAALAERRRRAREQAEREARLAEEERQRCEDEERRQLEEQMRLMEEARRAEEARLQAAIELAERQRAQEREEEERRLAEEERIRQQREAEEVEARQKAEQARLAALEKAEREEAERRRRRSRVAEIMARTRGATTPTKETSVQETNATNTAMSVSAPSLNLSASPAAPVVISVSAKSADENRTGSTTEVSTTTPVETVAVTPSPEMTSLNDVASTEPLAQVFCTTTSDETSTASTGREPGSAAVDAPTSSLCGETQVSLPVIDTPISSHCPQPSNSLPTEALRVDSSISSVQTSATTEAFILAAVQQPPSSILSATAHANGTNGSSYSNGCQAGGDFALAGSADSGVTSGEFGSSPSSLELLSIKSLPVSGDGDSISSALSSASTATPSLEPARDLSTPLAAAPPSHTADLLQM